MTVAMTAAMTAARWRVPGAEVPLDPSPEQGRSWLRRELLGPDYRDDNPVQQLFAWLGRAWRGAVAVAERTPPLTTFAVMLVVLLLLLAAIWLIRRTERSGARRPTATTDLVVPGLSSSDLRARAEAALAAGRHGDALVDAFRATATRQAERGVLEDLPGRTAHEVAVSLSEHRPAQADRLGQVARDFDLVLYGERQVGREEALAALALDDELAGRRTAAAR